VSIPTEGRLRDLDANELAIAMRHVSGLTSLVCRVVSSPSSLSATELGMASSIHWPPDFHVQLEHLASHGRDALEDDGRPPSDRGSSRAHEHAVRVAEQHLMRAAARADEILPPPQGAKTSAWWFSLCGSTTTA
jgi:hypothetical protein